MQTDRRRLSTGLDGLDEVLSGGFIEGRSYMLTGPAGAGKTILGMHFLTAAPDDDALFINLEEDVEELRADAASLGFDVDAVEFLDLSADADTFAGDESYEVFSAAEVEREPVTEAIVERVVATEPDRVFVDPLTQLRFLTSDDYQFRTQVVGFMRFLKRQDATVLFTTQETADRPAEDLQFIADGTVRLAVGRDHRMLTVPKFRGSATRSGEHAYRITGDGIEVFPVLVPGDYDEPHDLEAVSSGVPEVDDLLHGGLERGTVTIFSGPTGAGKTTLGTQFAKAAAERGERSVVYLFEETRETLLARSRAVDIPVDDMLDRGTLELVEVDPLTVTGQEFGAMVKAAVLEDGADIVMVDGLAGYRLTVDAGEDEMVRDLHTLGRFLKNNGVVGLFIDETADVVGEFQATGSRLSYLADNIVFLRHLELDGRLEKAIGVLKKRTTDFERTLRQYDITEDGVVVGEPLTGLRDVLSGAPEFVGERED
jgi:circadian clock protein KaiC